VTDRWDQEKIVTCVVGDGQGHREAYATGNPRFENANPQRKICTFQVFNTQYISTQTGDIHWKRLQQYGQFA